MNVFEFFSHPHSIAILLGHRHKSITEVIDMYVSAIPKEIEWEMPEEVEVDKERINVLLSEYPDYVRGVI